MTTRTAKLFTNGGSQAVRLPKEFRFEDQAEVDIRRDPETGDVILSKRPGSWADFFALVDEAIAEDGAPDDFMSERDAFPGDLRDPFEGWTEGPGPAENLRSAKTPPQ